MVPAPVHTECTTTVIQRGSIVEWTEQVFHFIVDLSTSKYLLIDNGKLHEEWIGKPLCYLYNACSTNPVHAECNNIHLLLHCK